MIESEASLGEGSNDDDSELDYLSSATPIQRERATRQLVWSWHRRLLALAGTNGDMSREKISEKYAELGARMAWVGTMMEQRNIIDKIIERHKKFDEIKIEELLNILYTHKADKEIQRKRVVGAIWSLFIILFTALCTVMVQEFYKSNIGHRL